MKFNFDNTAQEFLGGLSAVASAAGYRANDMRLTAKKGETPEQGVLKFEISQQHNYGEFELPAYVEEEGQLVMNSFFLADLPPASSGWNCTLSGSRLHVKSVEANYDFIISDSTEFMYDPKFADPDIDVSFLSKRIAKLAALCNGFVKRAQDTDFTGCVLLSSTGKEFTIQATNGADAIFGKIPLDTETDQTWRVLLPIGQFESWNRLPMNSEKTHINVDNVRNTITVHCGPIKVVHNTMSNLIDRFPAELEGLVGSFHRMASTKSDDYGSMTQAFRYNPHVFLDTVQRGVAFADGDPTIHLTIENDEGIIDVRTKTSDSQINLGKGFKALKDGPSSINRSSLLLVDRIKQVATTPLDDEKEDTWPIVRCNGFAMMVGTADGQFVAVTAQVAV